MSTQQHAMCPGFQNPLDLLDTVELTIVFFQSHANFERAFEDEGYGHWVGYPNRSSAASDPIEVRR